MCKARIIGRNICQQYISFATKDLNNCFVIQFFLNYYNFTNIKLYHNYYHIKNKIKKKKNFFFYILFIIFAMFTITLTQCVTSTLKDKNGFTEFPGTCMEIQYRLFNSFSINQKFDKESKQ